ncbi:CBS domain-containing protein [Limnovirga soli]|jgi:CBS domain-containing protein|uniref:CBS domain-containing protein n=1 Tax=Limnovirga soli TaxID=2656915 RepID=A0A8J8JUZ4_9BACT|nr:CBS domain-containing protein [Limnovirga soli]NNV57558.1 CBS domain-containing protein [Limnovirga soli]
MRTIRDVLLQKGPHFNFIDAEATVLDAIHTMKSKNISYLIVTENAQYMGIVSERDYTHKVILENKHSATTVVKEIMTRDLPIIGINNTPEECMVIMNASKSRYLPVFDGLDFKGVITIHDLMREAILQNEQSSAAMKKAMEDKSLKFY